MADTLFPPILDTFIDSFIRTDSHLRVWFDLSPYNVAADTRHIHIIISDQQSNDNVLVDDPNGIKIVEPQYDTATRRWYVSIDRWWIRDQWVINRFYKIQLRIDSKKWPAGTSPVDTSNKKAKYLLENQQYFSEWSTVALVRPLARPSFKLRETPVVTNGSLLFSGMLTFEDKRETETMRSYSIEIRNGDTNALLSVINEVVGVQTLFPNEINRQIDFPLTYNGPIKLVLTYVTQHNFKGTREFVVQATSVSTPIPGWVPTLSVKADNEEGVVRVSIKNKGAVNGTCVLTRADSVDRFGSYQTLREYPVKGDIDVTYEDRSVSSLIWYKYAIRFVSEDKRKYSSYVISKEMLPTFYNAFIGDKDRQLKLLYDYKVGSVRQNVNRTKIDTLGSKYPKFAENAVLKYRQMDISGTLAASVDGAEMFLRKDDELDKTLYERYKNNPRWRDPIGEHSVTHEPIYDASVSHERLPEVVQNDHPDFHKYPKMDKIGDKKDLHDTKRLYMTSTQNDWMWERIFREHCLDWLNDGNPKLYRSMAEGNMIVMLSDVSLSPHAGTSRMIWDFSATVYEIGDGNSLRELHRLGVLS